jgi:hypothetical protein
VAKPFCSKYISQDYQVRLASSTRTLGPNDLGLIELNSIPMTVIKHLRISNVDMGTTVHGKKLVLDR